MKSLVARQWALSQRIQTAAELPICVDVIPDRQPVPYRQIAERVAHLQELGMSNRAIGRTLGVSHWLVARALAYYRGSRR